MPWSEITPMDQRLQFIADVQRQADTMRALCARYGISRKTGYKWLARYAAEGPSGLAARSHRTHTAPRATAPEVVAALLALRQHHPTWGVSIDISNSLPGRPLKLPTWGDYSVGSGAAAVRSSPARRFSLRR
jgi:transposase-like protein